MARKVFAIGTTIRPKVTFTDPDNSNAVIDPATVTFTLRTPDGTLTPYTYGVDAALQKVSTGIYRFILPLNAIGTYKWKWFGSATQKSAAAYDEADSEKEAGF